MIVTGERSWTTASVEVLKSVLLLYDGVRALDFLTISPLRHGTLIKWCRTSSWWRVTWTWWFRIRWEITWRDLPLKERATYGLEQPFWSHADTELRYEITRRLATTITHRRCLGMIREPQRSFRQHVSLVFGLRSLADFRRNGEVWPTRSDFVQRHIDYTLVSTTPGVQMKWLSTLYREATQIVERLDVLQLVSNASSTSASCPLPYVSCTSGVRHCIVPAIPRTALLQEVWMPKSPTKQHPMQIHSQRVDAPQIKMYVQHYKRLYKIMLPVLHDLQFRLAFRLLPVQSRFWFLEAFHPDIRVCVRDGCSAIESEQHFFFDCLLASQRWSEVSRLVAPFFVARPTWLDIALGQELRIRDDWEASKVVVGDVWHVLRAVTLHFLWSDHNRCLFDGRQPTPAASALQLIFATFSAHIRFIKRRLYDQESKATLQHTVEAMKSHTPFGSFVGRWPGQINVWSGS